MIDYKVGICGYGYVGKGIHRLLKDAVVAIYDPYINELGQLTAENYGYRDKSFKDPTMFEGLDAVVISVMTKENDDGTCDTSIVEGSLKWLKVHCPNAVIIIKSAIVPSEVKRLIKDYKQRIVISPEFMGESKYFTPFWKYPDPVNMESHTWQVFGGNRKDTTVCVEIFKRRMSVDTQFWQTDAMTASLAKYIENSFFAAKVTFCNEWHDIAKAYGVDWNELRELWLLDPRINKNHTLVFERDRGYGGKCVHPDTRIYIEGCSKRMGDIKVGDSVLTTDGSFRKVSDVFKRKVNEDIYSIKPQGLQEIKLTGEHPVYAVRAGRDYYGNARRKLSNMKGNMTLGWVSAELLKKGDYVVLPIVNHGRNKFNEDVARLFGYYVAEGNISEKNRICFGFNRKEELYADDVISIIESNFPGVTCYEQVYDNCRNVRCTSKKLAKILSDNCGKGSATKKLSKKLMGSDSETLRNFLIGYFRGDGSKSTGVISMATISEELFYQLKLIILSFGIAFTTQIKESRIDKNNVLHQKVYTIRVRNYVEIEKFCSLVNDRVEKKLKRYRKTSWVSGNYVFVPIKSIEKEYYSGEVINIEVPGNNTFVLSDAIVHNCFPKDVKAIINDAKKMGYSAELMKSVDEVNERIRYEQGTAQGSDRKAH